MEKKYLSDGRKVVIIGKLNNDETIVQEIFINNNGDEIPSGERFVVKSLHNEPVLSYREKKEKIVEENIKRLKEDEKGMEKKIRIIKENLKAHQDILMSTEKLIKLIPDSKLEVLTMFMTGTIKYLVVDSYTITEPIEMIDGIINWENSYNEKRYDSIKLCSVLGRSGGELEYRIHQYSDDSGSETRCYPFTNLADALSHIKNRAIEQIKKNTLTLEEYNLCLKMGIIFEHEYQSIYEGNQKAKREKEVMRLKEEIEKNENKIKEILEKRGGRVKRNIINYKGFSPNQIVEIRGQDNKWHKRTIKEIRLCNGTMCAIFSDSYISINGDGIRHLK